MRLNLKALTLSLFLLALAPITPVPTAVANTCLYDCQGPVCSNFSVQYDWCIQLRAECQAKCSRVGNWGSIAYSAKDKGFGWSYGFADLNKAKQTALDNCSKHGAACKVWVWYSYSCGAIAADGDSVGWGTDMVQANAERRAFEECRKAGGKKCALQISRCSR